MATPKFNYKADEFYLEIMALAMKGLTDSQIAFSLSEKFNHKLEATTFSKMKNGKYDKWNDKQNKEYSSRIVQALTHGREKINSLVRGSYLKSALGGGKIKTKATVFRKIKSKDGTETKAEEIQETLTEQELAPNMQALATWLFNHDQEWRQKTIEGKKLDLTTNGKDIVNPIDYSKLSDETIKDLLNAKKGT